VTSSPLHDDCFLHDKDRMRHHEAVALLRGRMAPVVGSQSLGIDQLAGRFLAEPVIAPRNIPGFDNAAVDGYAFAFADHEPAGGFMPVTARIAAGQAVQPELPAFSAARIFTGAPMPIAADTVAMQEDCEAVVQDGARYVRIPDGLKRRANCRLAGEDVKQGQAVAETGNAMRPQDLAAIASTGMSDVRAFSRLRVGLLSSGNEILRPGQAFRDGAVYDANHFMLAALMGRAYLSITDLGVLEDDTTKLRDLLANAPGRFDVLISSGGASKGEEDHFVQALGEVGTCHLWQLAVKPGRPMAFGQIQSMPVFTLPGNPVAAFVCCLLYVLPALGVLAGGNWREPVRYPIAAGFSLRSKPDRREFLRGYVEENANGLPVLHKFERDGSGLISGLRAATGLIEIEEERTVINRGDTVPFIPFSQFGIV